MNILPKKILVVITKIRIPQVLKRFDVINKVADASIVNTKY